MVWDPGTRRGHKISVGLLKRWGQTLRPKFPQIVRRFAPLYTVGNAACSDTVLVGLWSSGHRER
jgi:hypothetical protein